jgi:hypothetical protein
MQLFGEPINPSVISLSRYAQLINYREGPFFGVADAPTTGTVNQYACREIWTKDQRDEVALYLQEAQEELENVLEYPIQPTWFVDEQHDLISSLLSTWGMVIQPGIRAEKDISLGAMVVHISSAVDIDPAEITIALSPAPAYPLSEIHVFYPGTDEEIIPSDIEYNLGTGNLVIYIPRVRLVNYSDLDNPVQGWLYSDLSHFQTTVDIKRIYNDSSIQAKLVYRDNNQCVSFCAEDYDYGCERILNHRIGNIEVFSENRNCCREYSSILINYQAGLTVLTKQAEMILIRLAHSKMPQEPCGCTATQSMWRRDRNVPQVMTAERINCPFGASDGAWLAWTWACGIALIRSTPLMAPSKLRFYD